MKLVSRKGAKALGLKKYFTGNACKHGHVCEKYTGSGNCLECATKASSKWKKENPESIVQWRKNNKDVSRRNTAIYRASKLDRTPKWLTQEDHKSIDALYKKAQLFSKYCGEPYEVDHKIPLQGDLVSGLHVPSNLRVISAELNRRKSNSYEIT